MEDRAAYPSDFVFKPSSELPLLDRIRRLDWLAFEAFVGDLYKGRGYMVEASGGSHPDGGYDLVLHKETETALLQCKHWLAWKVGVPRVRELVGAVYTVRATRGILVTTGTFSDPARHFAEGTPIELIDGEALVAIACGEPAPVKAVSAPSGSQACPKCQKPMIWRISTKGKHAGSGFWGCSTFPRCWGRREAA